MGAQHPFMLEKITVSLLFFAAVIVGDARSLRRLKRKESICYAVCLAAALYLTLIFVYDLPWPNLTGALKAVYGWPSERLIRLLKV